MPCSRRGVAVLVALFVIVLLGALSTAMVFAAREETHASAVKLGATRALAAVEDALAQTVANTDWAALMHLRPGQHTQVSAQPAVAITIVRLDTTSFFVQGVTPDPSAGPINGRIVRRVGLTIEVGADSAGLLRPLRVASRGWAELF